MRRTARRDPHFIKLWNTILTNPTEERDDLKYYESRDGARWCLGNAMIQIWEFLSGSYFLDANPLPHLRRTFRGFSWEFYYTEDFDDYLKVMEAGDYIWPAGDDWSSGIVIANQQMTQRENHRVICFEPQSSIEVRTGWPQRSIEQIGARLLVTKPTHRLL